VIYKDIIETKLNLLGVKFVESGTEYLLSQCLSPNHHDKKPSFSINTETGFCKCFGCGYTLTKEFFTDGVIDEDDLEVLERKALYAKLINKVDEDSHKDVAVYLPPISEVPTKEFRGLSLDLLKRAGVYTALKGKYKDRMIFPFYEENECRGYTSRALAGQEPKYLHNYGFNAKEIVYPYNLIKASGTDTLIVVEGVVDCLSAWELGIPAVCNFGVAFNFNKDKVATLLKLGIETILICLDKDEAGAKHTIGFHTEDKYVMGLIEQPLLNDNFTVGIANVLPSLSAYYKDDISKDLNDYLVRSIYGTKKT